MIKLDKDNFRTLLTMMFYGEWMMNSHKTNSDPIKNKTEELEQYIFSFAKELGFDHWIEYDEELKKYFPTADMEDELFFLVDEYNNRQQKNKQDLVFVPDTL